ncbi:MAG: tRNA threonylcarbamoyladenosine dehydratase, partial [Zoogloea sp.]|uniref:tRNA threonylcarbamoyladenosine dehydratase n=1 Tax=Zoogloea sp. TaxID=49181 RepID=UPI003F2DA606
MNALNQNTPYEDAGAARRFGGLNRLYGAHALPRLAASHVCVIGIGGVGSWAAEALARSGVGRLTLIDLDHVAESNINRQIHALEPTLGQAKIEAMAARIALINPACQVRGIDDFITPENVAALLPICDAVVDAIDQVAAKAALIALCRERKQLLVTTGGAGGRIDPTRIRLDDLSRTQQDALASSLRARLRKQYGFPRDPKKKFSVPCIYSEEPIRRPLAGVCAPVADGGEAAAPQGLNCAGYGSSVTITASFGMAAAAY